MTSEEISNVIAYGWTSKNDNPDMIGMYGNGLKSGSMRVANDCLILTKRNNECSALMISRTLVEGADNKDVSTESIGQFLLFYRKISVPRFGHKFTLGFFSSSMTKVQNLTLK